MINIKKISQKGSAFCTGWSNLDNKKQQDRKEIIVRTRYSKDKASKWVKVER
jgi:hypothetical protein